MHVLIVDDEPLARQRATRLVQNIEGFEVVGEAENGEQAISAIELLDPEIVLMDVRMPGMDGLTAAKAIADMPDPPAIIFCTAYDEYALQAFDTYASGYMVKPLKQEKLADVLNKAKRVTKAQKASISETSNNNEPESGRNHISAKTRNGIELIEIENIYCFVADQKYVTVIHSGGECLIDDTLKDLESELASKFVRIHRNALVAQKEIMGVEKNASGQHEVKLKHSDHRALISRRHLAEVRALLAQL